MIDEGPNLQRDVPAAHEFRHDSDLFGEQVRQPDAQQRLKAAMQRGFQTREVELALGQMLGELPAH